MRKITAVFISLIFLSGCATQRGPQLISNQRGNYNEHLIQSQNQQMLLNLVRLRYNDTPLFLDLNNIVTQFNMANNASISNKLSWSLASAAKPAYDYEPTLGLGASFSENPTFSYSPLQGEDFARQILTPISPDTIVLLSQSGWSISRLLAMCAQRINGIQNAPTASGPTPSEAPVFEDYLVLIHSLRKLQKSGVLYADSSKEGDTVSTRLVFDQASARQSGLENEVDAVKQRLGLDTQISEYNIISSRKSAGAQKIAMKTRSLLGVLFFLSQSVTVPESHFEEGKAIRTITSSGESFDWNSLLGGLMSVSSAEKDPGNAYVKVRYRDYWYFIADNDVNSKASFGLLSYLFALQSAEGKGHSPLLTLSAS